MGVIDVVDERIERPDPLGQATLDRGPLGRGEHPRDEIERPGSVAALAVAGRHLERDALLHEDRVAAPARGVEPLGP